VALDRQSIEKKDFPIGRRGYDPAAVDAHLAALADEIDELKRSSRRRTESLAVAASEQVRAIVEAAETTASEIQRHAEDEAREIRDEAGTEAKTTREQATSQAREYVSKVSESTSSMLQRLEAMENEMTALFESLRIGSNRLGTDLQLLGGNLEEVTDAVVTRPRFEPEPAAQAEPAAPAGHDLFSEQAEPEAHSTVDLYDDPAAGDGLRSDDEPGSEDGLRSEEDAAADETEGARLIALNMVLDGTPREEVDRYLADNFKLWDRRGLLDEVYASVEG
jgi:DivIVA domain-containing protein